MAEHQPDPLALPAEEMKAVLAGTPERAAALLRAGAEAGLAEAQAAYGQLLLDGRGVRQDARAALDWFRKAARSGHRMGMNMVGRCYEKGWGVAEDRVAAAHWYKAAAEAGLDWGMYNYGSALGLGAGVAKDEATALDWFRRAAALGHAKSINFVGTFLEEGRVVPRDMAGAALCYRQAAERGDFRGAFNHARLLAEAGRLDEALVWIGRAGEGATPHYRGVMRRYLDASPVAVLRRAGAVLAG
ncbi:tetratricopeptide repeat protein [Sphingomonas quercus]|uniref:Sel1 repeat family protein n=1 Tax=Sphingomonas quercus TaxID=2842451 RepID=A0ABS6BLY1_9SPHN|nr:tetratricopeptide repeat protein [Sphingomonas quercus]MBU3079322.1 sel1 repeat family protein [Sphingomonas quercus]